MQIELTGQAQQVVEQLIAQGRFQSADEAVEYALKLLRDSQPTIETLKAKIQKGLDDAAAGRVGPLDIEDVKRRGRERLAERNG